MEHIPVLLHEVIDGLQAKPGEVILDATVGGGGHSEALCQAVGGSARFVCLDADEDAIERSRKRLEVCGCTFHFYHTYYRHLDTALASFGIAGINRALFDLGLSSFQLEESGRGFSFMRDEPLQMTFHKIPPTAPTTPPSPSGQGLGTPPQAGGDEDTTYVKHERYPLLISNIKAVLKKAPKDVHFIIEDMGMRKIGRSLDEIAQIVRDVDDPRVKVCLDTCHLHVAGYDLSTKKKLDDFLAMFDKNIGIDKLECFHINDSRDEFGSLRDRHDNIGEGKVGKDVFKLILNHPKLKALPFLLEVPGFDDTGPDKRNVELLKGMV